MIANALIIAVVLFLAIAYFLMGELAFLVPYRREMFAHYGVEIVFFAALLFVNLFAASFLFVRKFLLKETGQKLLHMDKQIKSGHSDLSAQLGDTLEDLDA